MDSSTAIAKRRACGIRFLCVLRGYATKFRHGGLEVERLRTKVFCAFTGRLWHPAGPGPLWKGIRRVGAGQIEAYCRVLACEFRPRKIILFGSYATGSATLDSDVDLVVCLPFRGSATDKVVEIRERVEAPFPMDRLVW